MPPALYLLFLLVILLVLVVVGAISRYRCRRLLRSCARKWNMHFAPGDRLRLGRRIAGRFPVTGAANISVRDLLFRTNASRHEYLFTVDYTVGIIRGKSGRSCVAGFSEPVSRGSPAASAAPPRLLIAPAELSGPEAYESVLNQLTPQVE